MEAELNLDPDSNPNPESDQELITDPDPNLQIISDPAGSGCTTLDMTHDFKQILVKHLSSSGVLDKVIVIDQLIEFLDEKILDCTLGVNLDIVIFFGSSKQGEPGKGG